MTNTNNSTTSGGIGLPTVLFIVFLILKLTHVIAWSWWWVTAPLWITFIIGVIFLVIATVVANKARKNVHNLFNSSSRW